MTRRRARGCELDVDHTAPPRSRDGQQLKGWSGFVQQQCLQSLLVRSRAPAHTMRHPLRRAGGRATVEVSAGDHPRWHEFDLGAASAAGKDVVVPVRQPPEFSARAPRLVELRPGVGRPTNHPQARSAQVRLEAAGQVVAVRAWMRSCRLEDLVDPLELGIAGAANGRPVETSATHLHCQLPELRELAVTAPGNDMS